MASPLRRLRARPPSEPILRPAPPLGAEHHIVHNELVARGFALGPAPIAEVVAEVEGQQYRAELGRDSPDAAAEFPRADGAPRAGFEVSVDTSGWSPGERRLTLRARDEQGAEQVWQGSVEVLPFRRLPPSREALEQALRSGGTVISLEYPVGRTTVAGSGYFQVRGWAHSDAGLRAVVVTLDDSLRFEANHGLAREDLDGLIPGVDLSGAGFSVRIDARPLAAGRHPLTAVAIGAGGDAVGVEWPLMIGGRGVTESEPPAPRSPDSLAQALASGGAGEPEAEAWQRLAREWQERAMWLESDAAASRTEKDQVVYEYRSLVEQTESIRNSLSWRLTAPVRALGRLVRALRR